MGYTNETIARVERILNQYQINSVLDLGAQNNYSGTEQPAPYMREWYEKKGINYVSIDINGEHGALPFNLSKPITADLGKFDLVVDAGTSEHIGEDGKFDIFAIYNCWKTKHHLLKYEGIMINENPKSGNWPGHGFNYYTEFFYRTLAGLCNYEILELGEHAAMGNVTDGWNVHSILLKKDHTFPRIEDFELCQIQLT